MLKKMIRIGAFILVIGGIVSLVGCAQLQKVLEEQGIDLESLFEEAGDFATEVMDQEEVYHKISVPVDQWTPDGGSTEQATHAIVVVNVGSNSYIGYGGATEQDRIIIVEITEDLSSQTAIQVIIRKYGYTSRTIIVGNSDKPDGQGEYAIYRILSVSNIQLENQTLEIDTNADTAFKGVIAGTVSYGPPLKDVDVSLSSGDTSVTTPTDHNGRYVFDQLSAGTYSISTAKKNFKAASIEVTLTGDATTGRPEELAGQDITLTPEEKFADSYNLADQMVIRYRLVPPDAPGNYSHPLPWYVENADISLDNVIIEAAVGTTSNIQTSINKHDMSFEFWDVPDGDHTATVTLRVDGRVFADGKAKQYTGSISVKADAYSANQQEKLIYVTEAQFSEFSAFMASMASRVFVGQEVRSRIGSSEQPVLGAILVFSQAGQADVSVTTGTGYEAGFFLTELPAAGVWSMTIYASEADRTSDTPLLAAQDITATSGTDPPAFHNGPIFVSVDIATIPEISVGGTIRLEEEQMGMMHEQRAPGSVHTSHEGGQQPSGMGGQQPSGMGGQQPSGMGGQQPSGMGGQQGGQQGGMQDGMQGGMQGGQQGGQPGFDPFGGSDQTFLSLDNMTNVNMSFDMMMNTGGGSVSFGFDMNANMGGWDPNQQGPQQQYDYNDAYGRNYIPYTKNDVNVVLISKDKPSYRATANVSATGEFSVSIKPIGEFTIKIVPKVAGTAINVKETDSNHIYRIDQYFQDRIEIILRKSGFRFESRVSTRTFNDMGIADVLVALIAPDGSVVVTANTETGHDDWDRGRFVMTIPELDDITDPYKIRLSKEGVIATKIYALNMRDQGGGYMESELQWLGQLDVTALTFPGQTGAITVQFQTGDWNNNGKLNNAAVTLNVVNTAIAIGSTTDANGEATFYGVPASNSTGLSFILQNESDIGASNNEIWLDPQDIYQMTEFPAVPVVLRDYQRPEINFDGFYKSLGNFVYTYYNQFEVPVAEATLLITNNDDATVTASITSDAWGNVQDIFIPSEGGYSLLVSKDGFDNHTSEYQLQNDGYGSGSSIALTLTSLATAASYLPTANISGYVNDDNGNAVSGMEVEVKPKNQSEAGTQAFTTDENGYYTFTVVAAGEYKLSVSGQTNYHDWENSHIWFDPREPRNEEITIDLQNIDASEGFNAWLDKWDSEVSVIKVSSSPDVDKSYFRFRVKIKVEGTVFSDSESYTVQMVPTGGDTSYPFILQYDDVGKYWYSGFDNDSDLGENNATFRNLYWNDSVPPIVATSVELQIINKDSGLTVYPRSGDEDDARLTVAQTYDPVEVPIIGLGTRSSGTAGTTIQLENVWTSAGETSIEKVSLEFFREGEMVFSWDLWKEVYTDQGPIKFEFMDYMKPQTDLDPGAWQLRLIKVEDNNKTSIRIVDLEGPPIFGTW